jgi:hypothetical protein
LLLFFFFQFYGFFGNWVNFRYSFWSLYLVHHNADLTCWGTYVAVSLLSAVMSARLEAQSTSVALGLQLTPLLLRTSTAIFTVNVRLKCMESHLINEASTKT